MPPSVVPPSLGVLVGKTCQRNEDTPTGSSTSCMANGATPSHLGSSEGNVNFAQPDRVKRPRTPGAWPSSEETPISAEWKFLGEGTSSGADKQDQMTLAAKTHKPNAQSVQTRAEVVRRKTIIPPAVYCEAGRANRCSAKGRLSVLRRG